MNQVRRVQKSVYLVGFREIIHRLMPISKSTMRDVNLGKMLVAQVFNLQSLPSNSMRIFTEERKEKEQFQRIANLADKS